MNISKIFTIAACAVVMAACGGKKDAPAANEQANASATEEVTNEPGEAAESQKAVLAEATTFDKGSFAVTVPEGWTINEEASTMVDAGINGKSITSRANPGSMEACVNTYINLGYQTLDDVTVNGVTYKVLYHEASKACMFCTPRADKDEYFSVYGVNITPDDADVKTLLGNITLK